MTFHVNDKIGAAQSCRNLPACAKRVATTVSPGNWDSVNIINFSLIYLVNLNSEYVVTLKSIEKI